MTTEVVTPSMIRLSRQVDEAVSGVDRSNVTDLNAWRYARERAAAERREMSSLLDVERGA